MLNDQRIHQINHDILMIIDHEIVWSTEQIQKLSEFFYSLDGECLICALIIIQGVNQFDLKTRSFERVKAIDSQTIDNLGRLDKEIHSYVFSNVSMLSIPLVRMMEIQTNVFNIQYKPIQES